MTNDVTLNSTPWTADTTDTKHLERHPAAQMLCRFFLKEEREEKSGQMRTE